MKGYDKNKKLYFKYWNINDLCGWAMSQTLPVNSFERVKVTYQFNESFIESCNEESDKRYFLSERY